MPRLHPVEYENPVILEADVLAAIARMGAGDGLVKRATAALEGVTEGPWSVPGQPDKICAEGYTRNGMAKTIATVSTPAWMGDTEPWANACFIAFARQWVPEAAAHIAALTAQLAEAQKEHEGWQSAAMKLMEKLSAAEAEAAALRAKVARLEGALALYSCEDGCNDCPQNERDRVSCGWTARAALTDGAANA